MRAVMGCRWDSLKKQNAPFSPFSPFFPPEKCLTQKIGLVSMRLDTAFDLA